MTEPLCFDGRLSPARHMPTDLRAALKIFAAHPPVSRYEPLALATPAAGRSFFWRHSEGEWMKSIQPNIRSYRLALGAILLIPRPFMARPVAG
jgi:hypothetical protein